ncbi:MAG TPA: GNAT family N-acetyltransferase, partial [Candidatus Eisenbacteria bacterium]|nr:GNAT family N-acetyltransferase [Candidatus Eisenbacteria bacterium]
MFWKKPRSEFERGKGEGNRRALRTSVTRGEVPGLIAYDGKVPVGWCAVEPRERFPGLARSRVLAPVDEAPVWSVPCFFVARGWRRKGVTVALLRAAAAHAASRGAKLLEGYPIAPKQGKVADAFAWTGIAGAFEKAAFEEVARRSPTRPIMRRRLSGFRGGVRGGVRGPRRAR